MGAGGGGVQCNTGSGCNGRREVSLQPWEQSDAGAGSSGSASPFGGIRINSDARKLRFRVPQTLDLLSASASDRCGRWISVTIRWQSVRAERLPPAGSPLPGDHMSCDSEARAASTHTHGFV